MSVDLEQLSSQIAYLEVGRSALQAWENRHVDPLLDVWIRLEVLEKGSFPHVDRVRACVQRLP